MITGQKCKRSKFLKNKYSTFTDDIFLFLLYIMIYFNNLYNILLTI